MYDFALPDGAAEAISASQGLAMNTSIGDNFCRLGVSAQSSSSASVRRSFDHVRRHIPSVSETSSRASSREIVKDSGESDATTMPCQPVPADAWAISTTAAEFEPFSIGFRRPDERFHQSICLLLRPGKQLSQTMFSSAPFLGGGFSRAGGFRFATAGTSLGQAHQRQGCALFAECSRW